MSIYIFFSYCQLIDFLAWGSCSVEALLSSLRTRPKALDMLTLPVSFPFQYIKNPLHFYSGPLAGEDYTSSLSFQNQKAVSHNFSSHQNIPAF